MALILVVEDENLLRWALKRRLEQLGHMVHEAPDLASAETHLREHKPDVVLLDLRLPDGHGLDFLAAQAAPLSESVVVVMTAAGQVEDAVRAMKLGATDFLNKPLDENELIALVNHSLERQQERVDAERFRHQRERAPRVSIVADSPAMQQALELARTVAASSATTVLVQGETGTGKEVIARFIHAESPLRDAPQLALNCAALPEQLVESELFGHERGAFTDAKAMRKGLFELAQGGTVVLDEIGELPLPLQSKLLRFLEERSLRRVGGTREIYVDVRVLALSNRNLEESVLKGEFRSDLFYRLNVFPITIPPLRERREDILGLARHFLGQFGSGAGKTFSDFTPIAQEKLLRYDWPGNVRELRNLMERVAILEPGGMVGDRFLNLGPPLTSSGQAVAAVSEPESILPLEEVEFLMVGRAMRACRGNQSRAARLLGVSRDQLRYRLKKYRSEGRWNDEWDSSDAGDDADA